MAAAHHQESINRTFIDDNLYPFIDIVLRAKDKNEYDHNKAQGIYNSLDTKPFKAALTTLETNLTFNRIDPNLASKEISNLYEKYTYANLRDYLAKSLKGTDENIDKFTLDNFIGCFVHTITQEVLQWDQERKFLTSAAQKHPLKNILLNKFGEDLFKINLYTFMWSHPFLAQNRTWDKSKYDNFKTSLLDIFEEYKNGHRINEDLAKNTFYSKLNFIASAADPIAPTMEGYGSIDPDEAKQPRQKRPSADFAEPTTPNGQQDPLFVNAADLAGIMSPLPLTRDAKRRSLGNLQPTTISVPTKSLLGEDFDVRENSDNMANNLQKEILSIPQFTGLKGNLGVSLYRNIEPNGNANYGVNFTSTDLTKLTELQNYLTTRNDKGASYLGLLVSDIRWQPQESVNSASAKALTSCAMRS